MALRNMRPPRPIRQMHPHPVNPVAPHRLRVEWLDNLGLPCKIHPDFLFFMTGRHRRVPGFQPEMRGAHRFS